MTGRPQLIVARSIRVITIILVVAALYLGREILIPTALGLLLTFLLYPPVRILRRWGVPNVASVIAVIASFLMVIGAIGYLVAGQVIDLSNQIPNYRDNLRAKVRDIRPSSESTFAKLSGTLRELEGELATTVPASQAAVDKSVTEPEAPPVKVEVVEQGPNVAELISTVIGPIMVPVVGAGVTLLIVIFVLLQIDDLRGRLITYSGMRRISLTTVAMNEIGQRVGQFVRMQLIVNASYGVAIGIGLYIFGVPQALLWGVLGFALRFAPYVGPWLAAALPSLLTLAVFPGWTTALGVVTMFAIIEGMTNLVLEPWLYGSGTGITNLGVVYASIFWAWVWGPIGLLLAVPTTVCLTVMGKYLPQLSLLHLFFGTDVDVPKVGQFYQDLLAGDVAAADRIIDEELETYQFEQVCDELLLPALSELKRDMLAGAVEPAQGHRAMRGLETIVAAVAPPAESVSELRMLCVAGHSEADACAAGLLAVCCRARGVGAEALPGHLLVSEIIEKSGEIQAPQVAIVQVDPVSIAHSRRLIKALLARLGDSVKLIHFAAGDATPEFGKGIDASRVRSESTFAAITNPLLGQQVPVATH